MVKFKKFVYTPVCFNDSTLAISACRSGGTGIFNVELGADPDLIFKELDFLSHKAGGEYGLKLDLVNDTSLFDIVKYSKKGLRWLILDCENTLSHKEWIAELKRNGIRILAEVRTAYWPEIPLDEIVDGLVLKGNESGGFVGENSSFILLQKWRQKTNLPLFIRGGITPYVAAACSAVGAVGCVLDSQVLLLEESPLAQKLRSLLENLSGNETIAVGNSEDGDYFRLLVRPGHSLAQAFYTEAEGQKLKVLQRLVQGKINWREPRKGLLPIGQDVCFAGLWRRQYGHMAGVFRAIDSSVDKGLRQAVEAKPFSKNAPLARDLEISHPVVQGPMSRVSDNAEFANNVSQGGALPMIALALLKGQALNRLLEETAQALGNRPWGVGLLGFAPQSLLDEQLTALKKYQPRFAIIGGGRPDQVVKLEKDGIISFLHVPSANLIPMFLQEGVRNFIFEGRECGGHIGPLSSFVLWSTTVDCLLTELDNKKAVAKDIRVLFAGGIHDAVSSAIVQVLAAPLVNKGVKIGVIMGSSYLFTKEIVNSGALVPTFQKIVVDCKHTVNLQSGPGHASRCAYTPFAQAFFRTRRELRKKNIPGDKSREILDDLIMGKLQLASKGKVRMGDNNRLKKADKTCQEREGMYMLGQVAILRNEVTDIPSLHREITEDANKLLAIRLRKMPQSEAITHEKPADIAIVGIGSLLPKANTTQQYWENILTKTVAITEIPAHRWDWRLYYDENRQAKDKIYSKWGGFLDDLPFDPIRYGMPPKSIESIDPMQLMALEVARRTLIDAGYESKKFDRERTSVIIGASGGAGDFGLQYGLRTELPRFQGDLPDSVADRLPEWTEDTFPGILLNVLAGRIANRLNLGGANFTIDAACASSLAAIYQGVNELIAKRSDLVVAGGVDTVQNPFGYMCFSKTQALSPRGHCNTFDSSTDGIVISEGVAMIALKRLEDAERDGDRIYAVIKGVGSSSDGKVKALTAPSPKGQLRAMRRAYAQAGFGPNTVDLFEAHGTGTVAGDTAELESTTELLRETGAKPRQSVVGSVKTLIGHTKATAGVAGLIKATLALHHHVLPPHYGIKDPNPVLQQEDNPLYIIDEAMPWLKIKDKPRRAACSAFGFGGTNFHVVLEEYKREYRQWIRSAVSQNWPAELLLWTGNGREDLITQLIQVENGLKTTHVELLDLAYTLFKKWHPEGETIAIVATDQDDLIGKIKTALSYLKGAKTELPLGIYHSDDKEITGKVAVLFPGQGSQYTHMLRELALHFPVLAETLSEADELLIERFAKRFGEGKRLSHFIFFRGDYSKKAKMLATKALTNTNIAQPALGAVEVGLWRIMRNMGLKPNMLAGHSYGEFVALFAGDFIDFPTLISLSEARGRFIVDAVKESDEELGTMAAVHTSREEVENLIYNINDVIVANHNAPLQCIISGSTSAIQEATEKISKHGINVSGIPVSAAFHSRFVEPAQTALADLIKQIVWQDGNGFPVYSNTTGEPHSNDIQQIKQIMTCHLVKPVEFLSQVEAMYRDGARVFLELGPKAVLTRLVERILKGRAHHSIAIDNNGGGIRGILNAIAQLLCAGVKLDLSTLFKGRGCKNGDPENLHSIQRDGPLSKHIWMINGSSVRSITEPVKHVGIKLDELHNYSTDISHNKERKSIGHKSNPVVTPTLVSRKHRKEEINMGESRHRASSVPSSIMREYFDTMRQFLKTQEQVMSMYTGSYLDGQHTRVRPKRNIQHPVMNTSFKPEALAQSDAPLVQKIQKEITPQSNQAEDAPAKPVQADELKEGIDRKKMIDMLLAIVEERTGYPKDMLDLNLKLEADLGIDSIKRVEIVGALLNILPPYYREALGNEKLGTLHKQPTLCGMLDMLGEIKIEGEKPLPLDQAGLDTGTVTSRPFRHIIKPKRESIDESARKQLNKGLFLITRDKLGVAENMSEILRDRDCAVRIIEREVLKDETILNQWCGSLGADSEKIAGIVHLAQLGTDWFQTDAPLEQWHKQLHINEKSLFILLHNLIDTLKEDAHILSASVLGGFFCRESNRASGLSLQSGGVGLLKSLHEERQSLRVKAVDIDPSQSPDSIAMVLCQELEIVGGRIEVGYPDGKRTIFKTVPSLLQSKEECFDQIRNLVVLATGGLKGITAEVMRELALPGNTLLLTGRRTLIEDESEDLQRLTTASALQQHYISKVRNGHLRLTPAQITNKVQSILANREMRLNIEDFRQRGATVEYFAVDVTNEEAMQKLFDSIYTTYGNISGVVHGAGVIEDKLLEHKTSESWSKVVETKVIGLLLLQRNLCPDSIKFFTVFSSVAGRYGNSGQADYATANELMNRLCCQLSHNWKNKVNVKAFCWGPWEKTKFGTGMVNEDTEAKFAKKGVKLVSAKQGRSLFKDELIQDDRRSIEVVCGGGPWEEHEAIMGQIERTSQTFTDNVLGPLLDNANVTTNPKGDQLITLCLGKNHAYLQEHCIDDIPVVPAAAALEMMSEAADHLYPEWTVVETCDFHLLKGIELNEGNKELHLIVSPPLYSSNGGFQVNAAIQTMQKKDMPLVHYRAVLNLKHRLPVGFNQAPILHTEKNLSVTKAYDEWLFHGPRFQVIEEIGGLSDTGAKALLRTTSPTQWLINIESNHKKWIFDPIIIDAAAQMALLWARSFRNESALPSRFGRVVRYCKTLPERVCMNFERIESEDPHLVRANVYFSDANHNVVLLIENMECISSARLNRLGGTASINNTDIDMSISDW
ncbi:MAG: SDR family NAD(P)-dependent oxidoreductase [Thermodesulfobacteriota bacterium]|nr:SDR family NAD(P)-dependent oxidoreductase [Thermodesulfobacteriota bacterium]